MGTALTSLSKQNLDGFIIKQIKKIFEMDEDKEYATLSEVFLNFQELPDLLEYDFNHLGSLYWLDADKDGKFSISDFTQFAHTWVERSKLHKKYELHSQLQAYFTLKMWKEVNSKDGDPQKFIDWISNLMLASSKEIRYFDDDQEIPFVPCEVLKQLYEVFYVKQTHNIEFQAFVSLLQEVGEEKGIMNVDEEEQDDYVPLPAVQELASGFIQISFFF